MCSSDLFPLLLRAVWRILFLNTFIRYHILHQNAPCFALFCKFLFFFLRKRAVMERKERRPGAGEVFPQREMPWQKDVVCGDCQRLSLWESWQARQGLTERARMLTVGVQSLQSAPFLRFKNANFLRFKADFINSAQMSKIFEKSLDKGHSACYYEHMNRRSY